MKPLIVYSCSGDSAIWALIELRVVNASSLNLTMYLPGIAFGCSIKGAAKIAGARAMSRTVYMFTEQTRLQPTRFDEMHKGMPGTGTAMLGYAEEKDCGYRRFVL